jgi:hypothetical protein
MERRRRSSRSSEDSLEGTDELGDSEKEIQTSNTSVTSDSSSEVDSNEDPQERKKREKKKARSAILKILDNSNKLKKRDDKRRDRERSDVIAPNKFDGKEGESIDEFLRQFKEHIRSKRLKPASKVYTLRKYLGKTPIAALDAMPKKNKRDVEKCYSMLKSRWSRDKAREINKRKFERAKQQIEEQPQTFLDNLVALRMQGWPESGGWDDVTCREAIIKQFIEGLLNPRLRMHLNNAQLYKEWAHMTKKEFEKILVGATRVSQRWDDKVLPLKPLGVVTGGYSKPTAHANLVEFTAAAIEAKRNMDCYNCQSSDHLWRDCPNPKKERQYGRAQGGQNQQDQRLDLILKQHASMKEMISEIFKFLKPKYPEQPKNQEQAKELEIKKIVQNNVRREMVNQVDQLQANLVQDQGEGVPPPDDEVEEQLKKMWKVIKEIPHMICDRTDAAIMAAAREDVESTDSEDEAMKQGLPSGNSDREAQR